ncbi:DUF1289 domain-containing protein [Paludibacterium yongneupense]|uniref:DUF1289 domain-containing protein n=2 Tax=Paludibacterium yongneupense TaxID=400061 RepID=UPI0024849F13|nr:DUF1289 domain-containing protein [Paludibacterium yongneupense]
MNNASPCIAQCSTGLGDNVCRGCGRTFLEVANWSVMNHEAQQRVLGRLPSRRELQRIASGFGGLADIAEREGGEWGGLRVRGRLVWLRRSQEGWLVDCGGASDVATTDDALAQAIERCLSAADEGAGRALD